MQYYAVTLILGHETESAIREVCYEEIPITITLVTMKSMDKSLAERFYLQLTVAMKSVGYSEIPLNP